MFAHCLKQPTRMAGLTSPRRPYRFRERSAAPSLFGFAPGGVCHAGSVAGTAVRSYRTFSPLPCVAGRFDLCGTFPGVAPAGGYPAPHVKGARTFLPDDLSVTAGAAVRPADDLTHGHLWRFRQGTSGPILTFAPAWGGLFANVRIEGPLAKSSCQWSFWIWRSHGARGNWGAHAKSAPLLPRAKENSETPSDVKRRFIATSSSLPASSPAVPAASGAWNDQRCRQHGWDGSGVGRR